MSTISERLFSWGEKRKDGSAVETSTSYVDSSASAPDLAALRKAVTKGGRGRKSIDREQDSAKEASRQAALDDLFANENWEEIAPLYFDLRYAWTGFEYFKLSEKQRRVLAASLGPCMRILLDIDPRYIALVVFTLNFGKIIAEKESVFYQYKKKQRAERMVADGKARAQVHLPRGVQNESAGQG